MSISQNFPSSRPSLNLNFARSKKLDPRITFTRTSTATYVDEDGLVKSVATDTPRFEHNPSTGESLGLLIEESRTNLITYSEQFNNAAWTITNAGITTNTSATTAPDGSTNAEKLAENNTSGQHYARQSPTITANTIYTATLFAKAAERTKLRFGFLNSSLLNGVYAEFDLSAGSVSNQVVAGTATSASTSIISYPNGWYKCVATCIVDNSSTTGSVFIGILNASGNPDYLGDNTSGIYIWGAQLEAGAFPTSYIPTVASTATRSTDNASITGKNFSDFYNPSEGTLFAASRVNALGGINYPGIAYVDDGTVNNCIGLVITDVAGDIVSAEAYVSNINQYYLSSSSAVTSNQLIKAITAYKVNDFAAAFNVGSSAVGTDTVGTVPTVNRLIVGQLRGGNAPLNGTISQLIYYPVRLSNSQLQTLTR